MSKEKFRPVNAGVDVVESLAASMVEDPVETVLESVTDTPEVSTKEPVYGVVIDCSQLNVREKSNKNAKVLCEVKVGSKLVIDEAKSTADWFSVCTENGIEGFCMKRYIKVKS